MQAHASSASNAPTSDFTAALYAFLDKLSPSMIGRLYEAPASCLSIFRLLPPTARHIVLDMLWYERQVTKEDVSLWVRERRSDGAAGGERRSRRVFEPRALTPPWFCHRHLTTALSALARLHLLTEKHRHGTESLLVMHEQFRINFKLALTGGGTHGSFGVPAEERDIDQRESVDVAFLDSFAETQWETILHFMVGSAISGRPSDRVLGLLTRSGLMTSSSRSLKSFTITSKGFQFLLEDVNTQLWDLLLEYLEVANDVVEVLGFLFMVGSLELGRAYSTEPFSFSQLGVLTDLCDYGLLYRPSPKSPSFFPTRLATTLTSSAPPLVSSRHADEERGFLIIETNYKVYAYTSNPLQIAVLNLFVSLRSRYPNFVTGQITRDSVRTGLQNGITANQIIAYLTSRAHPQMRKSTSVLPTTVVDQIRLWEKEGERIKTSEGVSSSQSPFLLFLILRSVGYLYDDFSSTSDYDLVVNYARELGVLLWELPKMRKMFVTMDGHQQVREFIKRRMAGTG
ncbi:transcription initiation factor TFIIH subunit 4, partial [Phenoliferia sp. Uapishka_3]